MTLKAYSLPPDLDQDIETYAGEIERFVSGAMTPTVFKAKRVPRGIYEQRKDGTYMARTRIAGGYITGTQMRLLASLAREYSSGSLHITTRQALQFHDVKIENTVAIMRKLKTVGLTTKGGGGNTVRNITACPYAGVCPYELFDVSSFVQAATEFLIPLTGSYNLPRKYKIAFSGCSADCALAKISDLGFVAKTRNSEPGFAIFAGGGMGAHSRIAELIEEWLPVSDAIRATEAVRRLFDRLGDRQNRHRARLRFVMEKIGPETFRKYFREEMQKLAAEGISDAGEPESVHAPQPLASGQPVLKRIEGLDCLPQRQQDLYSVLLHLPMGMISSTDLEKIAALSEKLGRDVEVRTTRSQDILLRSVPGTRIKELASELGSLSVDVRGLTPLSRFVACAGSSTCRLGLCLSRNATKACADALAKGNISDKTLNALTVCVSGCPNSCGQHPSAPVGLSGAALRSGDHLVPAYLVSLGGRHDAVTARLSTGAGTIPAKALPSFMTELLKEFQDDRHEAESFTEYFERMGLEHFKKLTGRFTKIPDYGTTPDYYRDFGQSQDFSLAGRGAGECGAGVFDVIREDIALAKKELEIPAASRQKDTLFKGLLATVRALLITRGIDTRDADSILREFEKYFVDTSLISDGYRPILSRARGYIQGWATALDGADTEITTLLARVELLFSTLDANLVFHPPEAGGKQETAQKASQQPTGIAPDQQIDLTGVACPINFVKAKMRLEMMEAGNVLSIILDDGEPIHNVPASLKGEGHEILETTALNSKSWRVVVRKK